MDSIRKVTAVKLRHRRLRKRLSGTSSRPRLCVHMSGRHIYAQVVDDSRGITLASANTTDPSVRQAGGLSSVALANGSAAAIVGKEIATRALSAGVLKVVFDRGGFLYHGRVKILADAARSCGLVF